MKMLIGLVSAESELIIAQNWTVAYCRISGVRRAT